MIVLLWAYTCRNKIAYLKGFLFRYSQNSVRLNCQIAGNIYPSYIERYFYTFYTNPIKTLTTKIYT